MSASRTSPTRVFYETGVSMQWSYPTFAAPQARLDFLRNPTFGDPSELRSLPQAVQQTPAGDVIASSIAAVSVRDYRYSWAAMPEGFPSLQRVKDTATVQTQTPQSDDLTSADVLVSIGFRSFDGAEPDSVSVIELNVADSVVTTHSLSFSTPDLIQHPQGLLRRVEKQITTSATTKRLRIRAISTGQDFGITDVHADDASGTDHFASLTFHLDANADGVSDAWTLVSGSDVDFYGEDHAGLVEFIELVAEGALNTFEIKRPGGGEIVTVRVRSPIEGIGWPRGAPGVVNDVRVELVRPSE